MGQVKENTSISYDCPNILLLFKNSNVLDLLTFSLQTNFNFEVQSTTTIEDAYLGLSMTGKNAISMLICDASYANDELLKLLNYLKEKKLFIPILTCGDTSDMVKATVKHFPHENLQMSKVLPSVSEVVSNFFEVDPKAGTEPFCKVSIKTLVRFDGIDDDYYIRLKSGRYLKLFSKNDKIIDEDVTRYLEKGVNYLYLNRPTAKWVVKEINKDPEKFISSMEAGEKMPLDSSTRTAQDNEKSKEVEDALSLDKAFIDNMNLTINKTLKMIKKSPKLGVLLSKMRVNRNNNDFFNNHIGLLCNITCGLAKAMEWHTDATLEKLIFVSYMHDITLVDHPDLSRYQTLEEFEVDADKFSEEEKSIFLNHPEDVSRLVSAVPGAPTDAEVIILQHHENCKGTGFPNKVSSMRITPLSALFIVSHDLVTLIINDEEWSIEKFIKMNKSKYTGGNFKKVLRALRSIE